MAQGPPRVIELLRQVKGAIRKVARRQVDTVQNRVALDLLHQAVPTTQHVKELRLQVNNEVHDIAPHQVRLNTSIRASPKSDIPSTNAETHGEEKRTHSAPNNQAEEKIDNRKHQLKNIHPRTTTDKLHTRHAASPPSTKAFVRSPRTSSPPSKFQVANSAHELKIISCKCTANFTRKLSFSAVNCRPTLHPTAEHTQHTKARRGNTHTQGTGKHTDKPRDTDRTTSERKDPSQIPRRLHRRIRRTFRVAPLQTTTRSMNPTKSTKTKTRYMSRVLLAGAAAAGRCTQRPRQKKPVDQPALSGCGIRFLNARTDKRHGAKGTDATTD